MTHNTTDDFKTFIAKSASGTPQQLKKRQKYEALPAFIKAGFYYQSKFANVRQQGVPQRIAVCEIIKSRGTKNYVNNNIEGAIQDYEQALSVFRFAENKNPRWRYEGIKDDDLVFTEHSGTTTEEKVQIRTLKLSLYLNLSICYLKIEDAKNCLAACEETLKIDPKNPKALCRAAKALTSSGTPSLKEYEKAEEYLKKACEYDADNLHIQQELAGVSKEVQKLQAEQEAIQASKASKKGAESEQTTSTKSSASSVEDAKTQTFDSKNRTVNKPSEGQSNQPADEERSKYLDKYEDALKNKKFEKDSSEIWNMLHGEKDFNTYDYPLSYEVDPNAPIPDEIQELGRFLETRGKEILNTYEKTGKKKEATNLRMQLEHAKAAKKQLEKIAALDFNRPTQHLRSVAEKFGLDLQDPTIKNELKKIQAQNLKDIRAWIDSMSKQLNEREKNAIEAASANKKEEQSKKPAKQPATSTNNYYINNNYYSTPVADPSKQSEVKRRVQEASGKNRRERKNMLRAANSNRRHNNQGPSQTKGLSLLLCCVAAALLIGTIIAQVFGRTTQKIITTD